jgi:Zn-dependent protease with chaperone function
MQNVEIGQMQPQTAEAKCPECHAILPVHYGYVTWCDKCDWNLCPQEPDLPQGLLESRYALLGKKLGKGLFDELAKSRSLQPRLNSSKVLAFAIASLVHLITLICGGVGVWLVVTSFAGDQLQVPKLMLGAILIGVAWMLLPRFPWLYDDELEVLARKDFPALYRLADEIARGLSSSRVDHIVVGCSFNAAFAQFGWQRKNLLYLGLPLLSILDNRETIALLGHELAHRVNGDPSRGFFIGSALNSLARWNRLLLPRQIDDRHRLVLFILPALIAMALFMGFTRMWLKEFIELVALLVPVVLGMLILGFFARLGIIMLVHLLWRDMQRAEYLADALAVQASGTKAMLHLLEKMHLAGTFGLVLHQFALNNRKRNLFEELRNHIAQVPQRELERIRRIERLEATRLDDTHPPTVYRIALISERDVVEPKVTISPRLVERAQSELRALEPKIQSELLDLYG